MLHLLHTFVSVYETRNFTHTAEDLFLSQPTISAQIKKLEEHLQVELFIRNGKQEIIPTKEAVFLYPRALQIIEEWDDTSQRLKNQENFRLQCIIGCSHTCAVYFVPKLIPYLVKQFPNVDFSIKLMNSEEVGQQMAQNKVSIGFIEKPERNEAINQTAIYEDELVLAGKEDSPYWLLRENESGLRFYNEIYLRENNLLPQILYVDNNEAILALLREGFGRSIISKLAISHDIAYEAIHEHHLRHFYLLTHKAVFKDVLREISAYVEILVPHLLENKVF